jgi:histidinol dehydrogenase
MRILDMATNRREVLALARREWVTDPVIEAKVREIVEHVRKEGDEAVTTFTRQLDCSFIDSLGLLVSEREVDAARTKVSREFRDALKTAKRNIERFHRRQLPKSWTMKSPGRKLQHRVTPLERVGIYIPGGKAAYPSTVLMNAIPATIAGVKDIVMTTPCSRDGKITPEVLTAARECGITEIYRIGGAQAIAALAYGTESIRRVDKITGPGNAYVAAAKQMLYGTVGIDVIAGPTEVVIVADATARPDFIAADLIAQAEHDERAVPICLTTEGKLAGAVCAELDRQLESAPRRDIARRALDQQGVIVQVSSLSEAVELVNELAPEHLEVLLKNAEAFASKVKHAGSIFLGPWSTEALGDYAAGPNHTLPTSGTARFSSPLGVLDFVKFTNIISFNKKEFERLAGSVETLAKVEGLHGHAASVAIRRRRR